MKTTGRLIICIKDIQLVTGKSVRTAKRISKAIKTKHQRSRKDHITLHEFCAYMHLIKEDVEKLIS